MDEVQTTAHSEEIEEKMAKELLEEGKTLQVILGPMFYLKKKELINKKDCWEIWGLNNETIKRFVKLSFIWVLTKWHFN